MPVKLTTSRTRQVRTDAIRLTAFAVDRDRKEIHVSYTEGTLNVSNVFTAVSGEKLVTISGADFNAAFRRVNAIANAMPAGNVNVFRALRRMLYEYMETLTGMSGTII